MSLIYFVSGLADARREAIEGAGLAHAFDVEPCPFATIGTSRGPDDSAGLLVAVGAGREIRATQKSCLWTKAPGADWWAGVGEGITPESMERREQIEGHLVRLNDGQEWRVPVARSILRGSALPAALVLGPDGAVVREGLPEFAKIGATAERVERMLFGQALDNESEVMDLEEGFAIAVQALAMNYRVGPVEVSAMRLLTDAIVSQILRALVDVPTMIAVAREKRDAEKNVEVVPIRDGSGISDGVEG